MNQEIRRNFSCLESVLFWNGRDVILHKLTIKKWFSARFWLWFDTEEWFECLTWLKPGKFGMQIENNPIIWWNQGLSSVKSAAESYCLVFNSLIFRSNIWNAVKCIGKISVWDCLEYIKVRKDAIFCLEKGLFSDWKALCKHPTDYWNLMNMLGMPLKELSKPPLKWLKMIRNHWVSNLTKMT